MERVVVLTGGGTAGHVMPHLAILDDLKQRGWHPIYVGTSGIEKKLVAHLIPFYEIRAGKLRRYFSFQNALDVLNVLLGFFQSLVILFRQKPKVVFSKGGFVSVPVAWAAWMLGIPVVSHESDYTPGLANRLIAKVAHRILYTFSATKAFLPPHSTHVGLPVRASVLRGAKEKGEEFCGFSGVGLPTLLVIGGSQGSATLNRCLEDSLPRLGEKFRIVHIAGFRNADTAFQSGISHYKRVEFLNAELADVLALADIVVSRAGANSIFELLTLNKPMLLVPLEKGSRGDQIENAHYFSQRGFALTLREQDLNAESLCDRLDELLRRLVEIKGSQSHSQEFAFQWEAVGRVIDALEKAAATTSRSKKLVQQ